MAFIAVLVKGDKGAEGERGCFKTDDEHQEVTARNHEIHAEEGQEHKLVEFTATDGHKLRVGPLDRLYKDDEDTYIENILDGGHDGGGDVHTGERRGIGTVERTEAPEGEHAHQEDAEGGNRLGALPRTESIEEEYEQEYDEEPYLLLHC